MSTRFRVLHVCTGNICRSPLAERLMRQGLRDRLGDDADMVVIESAGTMGITGSHMEPDSAAALAAYGVEHAHFRARELVTQHIISADLILTATRQHRAAAVRLHPPAAPRTFTLREFGRLSAGVDTSALISDGLVERGQALVRAVAAQRGWIPPASPADDDVADPYRGPAVGFTDCARLMHEALQRPLDLLAGTHNEGPR